MKLYKMRLIAYGHLIQYLQSLRWWNNGTNVAEKAK